MIKTAKGDALENDIKTFYDLTAEKTADEWYSNQILLLTIKEFLTFLPPQPKVLDLGCGPGYESMRLHREGAAVLGIDFSETNIRIARERCPDCRFEIMDFSGLDQRYGRFDGVFASASLIHVAPDQIVAVMGRISDILKEQGFLLAIIRDGEGIDEKASDLTVEGWKLRRTLYQYTQEQITRYAERTGLHFVREGYLDPSFDAYHWKSYLFQKK